MRRLEQNNYVLPAIQREFVWKPEQIAKLFDSLMQGYPFGTFLFWKVEPASSSKFKFYGFVQNYHERDNPHCPLLGTLPNQALTAVLDGQQRLTALNIGLRGSMAVKEPNKWWTNPNAFPKRVLRLNLLSGDKPDEDGILYDFQFLDDARAVKSDVQLWFKVPDILVMASGPAMLKWLVDHGLTDNNLTRHTLFSIACIGQFMPTNCSSITKRRHRSLSGYSIFLFASTAEEWSFPILIFYSALLLRSGQNWMHGPKSIASLMNSTRSVQGSPCHRILS